MSKKLIAKPVVADAYWVVTDGEQKVGNVIAAKNGYNLILGDNVQHCANTADIMREYSIQFENRKNKTIANGTPYAVWPTTGKTYNNMLDIKRRLHLYTKSRASKCYYVAGYFALQLNGIWSIVHCPKYIFVQRYQYSGPYMTEYEAQEWVNSATAINIT